MNQETAIDTASSPISPGGTSKRLLPWLVAVAFFMESLDTTILNTAVPTIAEALKVAPLSMKSVLASYTLSLAVFIPISGWMADRFGTRQVFAQRHWTVYAGLVALRTFQQHSCAGRMPHFARLRRSHDGACRALDDGSDICKIRTNSRDEFRRDPRADWADAWADCRRIDRRVFPLARDFFRERADWPARPLSWFTCTCRIIAKKTLIRWI